MPGRVKKRVTNARLQPRRPGLHRRHPEPLPQQAGTPVAAPAAGLPAPAAAPPAATTTQDSILPAIDPQKLKAQIVNKTTLPWLIIASILLLGALILISWLLCKCRRRRNNKRLNRAGGSYHSGLEVRDGRNDHHAWYRHAPKNQIEMRDVTRTGTADSRMPLVPAAVRPAGTGVHVVDEEGSGDVSPMTARYGQGSVEDGRKDRYYSGLGNVWKRISQIGRAY